jgi:hypothetical protein
MSDDRALREARLRGEALVSRILAEPAMLDLETFAARAGMTANDVKDRWGRREFLALESPNSGPRFPEWQLGPHGRPLPAIGALLGVLTQAWAVYRFLMQHHPELSGQTGLEAITSGRTDEAVITAQGIVDGNFS